MIAAIPERPVSQRILTHLGLQRRPPPRGRAHKLGRPSPPDPPPPPNPDDDDDDEGAGIALANEACARAAMLPGATSPARRRASSTRCSSSRSCTA
jgi:hypothetical protein